MKKKRVKNPVSTGSGMILILVGILSFTGIIKSDQAATLNELAPAIVQTVAGIISIFKSGDSNPGI
ncbi:MAG TPA: hypothetical protein DDX98_09285 [Bacteroidales bacterium]|jgi:hypothetical protein|nr:hypothetical protein [Bacteroidales bacterium]